MNDARAVLAKYGIVQSVEFHETPKPGDPAFKHVQNMIVGSNEQAIDAAARCAKSLGYRTMVLSTRIEGETRDVALVHAAIAKEILATGRPLRAPACVLSGGETTVTIRRQGPRRTQSGIRSGRGDRARRRGCGDRPQRGHRRHRWSHGRGGSDCGFVYVSRAQPLNAAAFLANNDSYHFFEKVEGLIKTGPTGTNVMDVRVVLVGER